MNEQEAKDAAKEPFIKVQGSDEGEELGRSQFDDCPGCGTIDNITAQYTGDDIASYCLGCTECQWFVQGESLSEIVENWNRRSAMDYSQSDGERYRTALEEIVKVCDPDKPTTLTPVFKFAGMAGRAKAIASEALEGK